jgi:hypothetical protein
VIDEDDNPIHSVTVKCSKEELFATADGELSIRIDADFRYAGIASMLKAAHLTFFKLFGYKYVFSYSGKYLGDILRRFYENHIPPAKCSDTAIKKYFRPFETMVVPLEGAAIHFKGTLTDNRAIFHYGKSGSVFAIGVIVKAGPAVFCVFMPGMDSAIDTYFDFLKSPPTSVAVKIAQYCPGSGEEKGYWEIPDGEPIRVAMHPPDSEPSEIDTEDVSSE